MMIGKPLKKPILNTCLKKMMSSLQEVGRWVGHLYTKAFLVNLFLQAI